MIGLGYIGWPTAAVFATHGCRVVGVDISDRVIEMLNKGAAHLQEPGLKGSGGCGAASLLPGSGGRHVPQRRHDHRDRQHADPGRHRPEHVRQHRRGLDGRLHTRHRTQAIYGQHSCALLGR